jgi:hypothetical protein
MPTPASMAPRVPLARMPKIATAHPSAPTARHAQRRCTPSNRPSIAGRLSPSAATSIAPPTAGCFHHALNRIGNSAGSAG